MRIVAFGDSTTARRDDVEKVYLDRLGEQLSQQGVNVETINAGVPGNNTNDARKRFETDVLQHEPDLVIVQFGLNDSAVDVWKDPPARTPRVSLDEYRQNLEHFVTTLCQLGTNTILMTANSVRWTPEILNLYGKPPYDPADPLGFNLHLPEYMQVLRQIGSQRNLPLVDMYSFYENYSPDPQAVVRDLLPDGMHPNDNGHAETAQRLFPMVMEIVLRS